MNIAQLKKIHKDSYRNRNTILSKPNDACGCFYCLSTFLPSEIKEWVDNKETAVCPKCGIDAVIAQETSEEVLSEMYRYWFGTN